MHVAISLTPLWGLSLASMGRALDLLSTWWVTPRLRLEGNPLIKRYGWTFALAWSLLFPILGSCAPGVGIMIGACSCMMAFSNMHLAFIARHAPGARNTLRALNAHAMRACSFGAFCLETAMLVLPAAVLGLMGLAAHDTDRTGTAIYVAYGVLLWCAAIPCFRLMNWLRFQRALRQLGTLALVNLVSP